MKKNKKTSDKKIITKNKKAFFEYHITDRYEAGISLVGSEVKSLRDGRGNLSDAYIIVEKNEAYLLHAHISPYGPANQFNHEPKRRRKLLLHKQEILKFSQVTQQKGLTLVPICLYFRKGKIKVEIGMAKGKKLFDKRETIKRREEKIKLDRAVRR